MIAAPEFRDDEPVSRAELAGRRFYRGGDEKSLRATVESAVVDGMLIRFSGLRNLRQRQTYMRTL